MIKAEGCAPRARNLMRSRLRTLQHHALVNHRMQVGGLRRLICGMHSLAASRMWLIASVCSAPAAWESGETPSTCSTRYQYPPPGPVN